MSGIRNLTRLPGIRSSTRSRSRIRTDASRARERVDAWEVCIKSPHSPYVSRSLDPCFPIYQRILLLGGVLFSHPPVFLYISGLSFGGGGGGHGSCFCSHPHPFFPICHTFPFFLTTGICVGRCFFSHPPISPPHARFVPIYNISPYIYRYHPIHNHPIYISPASPHIYIYITPYTIAPYICISPASCF